MSNSYSHIISQTSNDFSTTMEYNYKKATGLVIGISEIFFFFFIISVIRIFNKKMKSIDFLSYFWLSLTILTMFWEIAYIYNDKNINEYSKYLIDNNQHVWSNRYPLQYLLPNKLAEIFYAEYGAYADREYMVTRDHWSRIIEGTHAFFCGIFSFCALVSRKNTISSKYLLFVGIAMGSQIMNSVIYMGQYFIETTESYSVNYNSTNFPVGNMLLKRPFMYVNIFWTIMPAYVIIKLSSKKIKKIKNNTKKK